jgi:IS6 family transposase
VVGCVDLSFVRHVRSRFQRSPGSSSLRRSSCSRSGGICDSACRIAILRSSCPNAASKLTNVTLYRWVQRFTPLLVDAARPCRHTVGDRWFVDETYVKVAGRWRYVHRAIDQYGQVIDVYVSARRDTRAARRFFVTALRAHVEPTEVITDRAWTFRTVVDELIPAAFHNTMQYANNRIEGSIMVG